MGVYVENDWTRYAQIHGLNEPLTFISPIYHKRFGRSVGMSRRLPSNLFTDPVYRKWLRDRTTPLESNKLTIMEYKKTNANARPFWARTFAERGVSSHEKGWVIPKDSGIDYDKFYFMEREIFSSFNSKKILVERLLDGDGNCRQVTIIQSADVDGLLHLRQENWVSNGRWKVSQDIWWAIDNMAVSFSDLLHQKPGRSPISIHSSNVAQS